MKVQFCINSRIFEDLNSAKRFADLTKTDYSKIIELKIFKPVSYKIVDSGKLFYGKESHEQYTERHSSLDS